ncbi:hypothetical protein LEP1GSC088_4752 [Leptospira interrogans str. L1207]|nr:hypothetical protein LEP1GSC088_4752 [Leptospira interrogans str. L1207]
MIHSSKKSWNLNFTNHSYSKLYNKILNRLHISHVNST